MRRHLCRTACPLCAKPYTMQAVEDPGRLVHNPKPKWEVPLEPIEWQPSYTQKVYTPYHHSTRCSAEAACM